MCSLPEPRRGVQTEGPQAAVPMAGLPLCELRAGGGEAAGDGGAGGPEETAGGRGEPLLRAAKQFLQLTKPSCTHALIQAWFC